MSTRRTILFAVVAAVASPWSKATAEGRIAIRPAAPAAAVAEHFTGAAEVSTTFAPELPARASGATVRFAPSSRTDWHVHPLGQTLVVLSGTGFVQRWGYKAQRLAAGDVASIPPGAKHWHGAGPTEPMVHLAISERLKGKTVDWLERVSDAQYLEATG